MHRHLCYNNCSAELILETCVFTKNRLQFPVIYPHLNCSYCHAAKTPFPDSLHCQSVKCLFKQLSKARWCDQLASSELSVDVACPRSDPFVV